MTLDFFDVWEQAEAQGAEVSSSPVVSYTINLTRKFLERAQIRQHIASFDPAVVVTNDCENREHKGFNYSFQIECLDFEFRQNNKRILYPVPDAPEKFKLSYDFSIEVNHRIKEGGENSENHVTIAVKTNIGNRRFRKPVSFSMRDQDFTESSVDEVLGGFFQQTSLNVVEIKDFYQNQALRIKARQQAQQKLPN